MNRFKNAAVGGTFDELHKGHKALLTKAFEISDNVVIGLCSDEFVKDLGKPHVTAPYTKRLEELTRFLEEHSYSDRYRIIPLDDVYGVTLSESSIDAIVVSQETEQVAFRINNQRRRRGLSPLAIVTISMIPSQNHSPISTTRIRRGEIDRQGRILSDR